MDIRSAICFELSRRLTQPPLTRTVDRGTYSNWRAEELAHSWSAFSDTLVSGKDVLDFGCGDGQLAAYLLSKGPRSMTGVDLDPQALERARRDGIRFLVSTESTIPLPDDSCDTIVAFDMMEHVMAPAAIVREWFRVLRPGGRVAIEWFPFKGAWGPHMEALVPIPWAHVIFGERAMFRAAAQIYDLPNFVPRHWDLENGVKKPNKWRRWSTFKEQGYVNQLDIGNFERITRDAGFRIARFVRRGFNGPFVRRALGKTLMRLPLVGEYFVVSVIVELGK